MKSEEMNKSRIIVDTRGLILSQISVFIEISTSLLMKKNAFIKIMGNVVE